MGIDDEDTTHPGTEHKLLAGPADASVLATLGATVAFYATRLEQLAGELRRAPLSRAQRRVLSRDLSEVARETAEAAKRIEEHTPPGDESDDDGSIDVVIGE